LINYVLFKNRLKKLEYLFIPDFVKGRKEGHWYKKQTLTFEVEFTLKVASFDCKKT